MNLNGKRILVTGSSRGIGRAIAEEAARRGASVVVHGRQEGPELQEAFASVRSLNGRAVKFAADLISPEAIAGLFARIDESLGGLDALVNNAATQNGSPILDLTAEDWDFIMAVNLRAPFLCAQLAAQRMVAQGGGGTILNISSVHARDPRRDYAHYSSSKAGLEQLTRCLALELGEYGIRANSIMAGAVATDLTPADRQEAMSTAIPLGRVGRVDEIARMAAFMCSDECVYQTGASVTVDGGLTLGFSASRRDL